MNISQLNLTELPSCIHAEECATWCLNQQILNYEFTYMLLPALAIILLVISHFCGTSESESWNNKQSSLFWSGLLILIAYLAMLSFRLS